MDKSLTNEKIIELSNIHNGKYIYDRFIYTKSSDKIIVKCPEHGYFEVTYNNHFSKKTGCRECKKKTQINFEKFIEKSKDKFGDKFEYHGYINNRTKMEIICPKHGKFNNSPQTHLMNEFGCKKCSKEFNLDIKEKEYIIESNILHTNLYNYDKVKYEHYHKKVTISCTKHGDFEQSFHTHLKGHGCPTCSSSQGELEVENYLKYRGIDYIKEHSFEDCKNVNLLRFDFYLPKFNILIEYDGRQHFEEVEFFSESLDEVKKRDNIKNEYCVNNNIPLIRISYKQSVKEELDNLFQN